MKFKVALFYITSFAGFCSALFQSDKAAPIEIVGTKFFNTSNGEQFFVRGIAYQRQRKPDQNYDAGKETAYIDSLASPTQCLKDLEYFKELGVNVVRVYQIDPTLNHDVCMNAFGHHGIYVLCDLSEPQTSIRQKSPTWDTDLLGRYKAVVESMHSYPNVLGFLAGNEVFNNVATSGAAAFVKAAVRDTKEFIKSKGFRRIPVGYASADDSVTRMASAEYFVCEEGVSKNATVDFYGINMFEWCGYSSYQTSGYRERTLEFSQMPVPVFFTEYGCNTFSPRPFTEIDQLFGPTMSPVWSGGIIYEFFQNDNNYGLVEENSMGHMIKLEDFNIVKLRLIESVPRGVKKTGYTIEKRPQVPCPSVSSAWNSLHSVPETPDEVKCKCLVSTLSCVVTPYSSVDESALLEEVCALTDCLEILADGSTGQYGKFASCGMSERVSYALNKYWVDHHRTPDRCDFGRRAVLMSASTLEDPNSIYMPEGRNCTAILAGESLDHPQSVSEPDIRANTEQAVRLQNSASKTSWKVLVLSVMMMSCMYLAT